MTTTSSASKQQYTNENKRSIGTFLYVSCDFRYQRWHKRGSQQKILVRNQKVMIKATSSFHDGLYAGHLPVSSNPKQCICCSVKLKRIGWKNYGELTWQYNNLQNIDILTYTISNGCCSSDSCVIHAHNTHHTNVDQKIFDIPIFTRMSCFELACSQQLQGFFTQKRLKLNSHTQSSSTSVYITKPSNGNCN